MGPKKKKKRQPRNAFWFFMQEESKKLGKEGKVWHNVEELVQICSPRWQQLGKEDREKYEHMAKKKKEEDRLDLSNRFDHQGRSLLDIENEQKDRERYETDMRRDVQDTVQEAFKTGTLVKEKFYFVHFNTMCTTMDGRHLPCEMSVCEYSLSGGLSRLLHAFVRPPPSAVPVGVAYQIIRKAKDTHKLDLDVPPMQSAAASNYANVVRNLLGMISPEEVHLPPLYTLKDDVEKATQLLEDIFHWGGYASPAAKNLRVYNLHELFFQICNEVDPTILSNFREAAEIKLSSEDFLFSIGSACRFHDEVDRQTHCSCTAVRNWAYIISDTACQFYDVDLIPGRHLPADRVSGDSGGDAAAEYRMEPEIIGDSEGTEWELDPELRGEEELTPFGQPKTRAAPSGHTMPVPNSAELEFVRKKPGSWREVSGSSSLVQSSTAPDQVESFRRFEGTRDYEVPNTSSTSDFPTLQQRGRGREEHPAPAPVWGGRRGATSRGGGRGRGLMGAKEKEEELKEAREEAFPPLERRDQDDGPSWTVVGRGRGRGGRPRRGFQALEGDFGRMNMRN